MNHEAHSPSEEARLHLQALTLKAIRSLEEDSDAKLKRMADHVIREVGKRLETLETKVDALMAFAQETLALIQQLNVATTAIGARIQALVDRLQDDPTDEESTAIIAGLQAEIERLNSMGTSNTNPVPPVPPV